MNKFKLNNESYNLVQFFHLQHLASSIYLIKIRKKLFYQWPFIFVSGCNNSSLKHHMSTSTSDWVIIVFNSNDDVQMSYNKSTYVI